MSRDPTVKNYLRQFRQARNWSQDELARRAGISRAGISAIEIGRVVPSAAAALILAAALQCRVEDLFHLTSSSETSVDWAWPPTREPCRFWHAEVDQRILRFPVEYNGLGVTPADGLVRQGQSHLASAHDPANTLVLACCDPAVGLLVQSLAQTCGVRLLVFCRSSLSALALLRQKVVHVAGLHLHESKREGNLAAVKKELGPGYRLLRLARWQAGLTVDPQRKIRSPRGATQARLRWIGREVGSGARQGLDEFLGKNVAFRRLARDHRGVAEAIRCGWADIGVSVRLIAEEAGLDFLYLRDEAYDLCYRADFEGDPRFAALLQVVRSAEYRGNLGDLPGYDSISTGEVQHVE